MPPGMESVGDPHTGPCCVGDRIRSWQLGSLKVDNVDSVWKALYTDILVPLFCFCNLAQCLIPGT